MDNNNTNSASISVNWEMIFICAWCLPHFHIGTHGICPRHYKEQMEAIERMAKPPIHAATHRD